MTDVYSKYDLRYGLKEQAAWGTAEADNATVKQLCCDPFHIPQSVNIRKAGGSHAARVQLAAGVTADQYLAMPEVSLKMMAKQDELALLLYGHLQAVTEGASTPYPKTFTYPATQPDFATSNAGSTLTLYCRDAVAADSWKLKDVIVKSLEFNCNSGERLMVTAGLIGRGAPATSTPSGTWARSAEAFWNFATIARKSINFGSGAQTLVLKGFDIKLEQKVDGVGQSSGDIQNFGLPERNGTITIRAVKDANYALAIAAWKAGTQCTVNIGWGNATPGTDDADLDFTAYVKLTDVSPDTEDVYGFSMTGELVMPDISTSAITIVMADANDWTW